MKIEDVIRVKGQTVITIAPNATVTDLAQLLVEFRIGAVVVSTDGTHIEGIVSERDVVRGLAEKGADVLAGTVADLMTSTVTTGTPGDAIEDTAHTMTYERIRHMPVLVDNQLVGLISIGDVVKSRIDQLTEERNALLGYLNS